MYSDTHKYFLQFMIKHNIVSREKALEFSQKCSDTIKDINDIQDLIAEINQKIRQQELKIASAACEISGKSTFILINTANDGICKFQNNYTAIETEYFQQLLKEIVTAEDHRLQCMACYNLTDTLTGNLHKDTAETLLNKWMEQGYLVKKNSFIYLGPKCIVEFAPYFSLQCKDYYTNCGLCSEAVFSGRICSLCNKITHSYCIEKWLVRQKKCPNCKGVWKERNETTSTTDSSDESDSDEENITTTHRSKIPRLEDY